MTKYPVAALAMAEIGMLKVDVLKPWKELLSESYYVKKKGRLAWSSKDAIVSKLPYTIKYPTPAQADIRYRKLPDFMKGQKGKKGVEITDIGPLPAPAAALHKSKLGTSSEKHIKGQFPRGYRTAEEGKAEFFGAK